MRIFWTRPAQHDLNAIFAYTARDNPRAALRLCNEIEARVRGLSTYPGLGRPGRIEGTRELILAGTPYIVPYRVKDNRIEILAVFHAARKWPEDIQE